MAVSHAVRHQLMTDTPATAGKQQTAEMLATARTPAATAKPALSKCNNEEKAQLQQQKCQQVQDLCGKAIKVAGNEARNISVNVAVIKKIGGSERSLKGVAVKAFNLATLNPVQQQELPAQMQGTACPLYLQG